jgi:hypothetical protein
MAKQSAEGAHRVAYSAVKHSFEKVGDIGMAGGDCDHTANRRPQPTKLPRAVRPPARRAPASTRPSLRGF